MGKNPTPINIDKIYVMLLDEGINVYRPVKSEHLYGDVHRISEQEIPEGETWEFQPGDLVVVKMRLLSEGEVLVATSKVDRAGV